jgi:hypothetical protein
LRPTGHHDRRAGLQLTAWDAGGASAREGNVHGASRREEKASRLLGPNKGGGNADLAAAAVELLSLRPSFLRSFDCRLIADKYRNDGCGVSSVVVVVVVVGSRSCWGDHLCRIYYYF